MSQPGATDNREYEPSYSENGLWSKIKEFSKKGGVRLIIDALKLYYAMKQKKATPAQITAIIGALGYFIAPIDAISDILPGGLADDASVLALAVATLSCCADNDVVKAATDKAKEWFR